MRSITELPQKVKLSAIRTTSPATFTRCPGCFCWHDPRHFVWVPPGLIDESEFVVCVKCALTIRHAFTVLTEKAAKDAAAVVCNAINYIEMGGCAK